VGTCGGGSGPRGCDGPPDWSTVGAKGHRIGKWRFSRRRLRGQVLGRT
jgi:hypothetical protein